MSKLVLLLLCCLLPLVANGKDGYVFSNELLDKYAKGVSQNENSDYIQAYRTLAAVERKMRQELDACHLTPSQLDDSAFEYPYFPAKKSFAEVAYKLGNHIVAKRISDELKIAIASHSWADEDSTEKKNAMLGDIAKIDADNYYLTENYDSARAALQTALQYKPYDFADDDFRSKVFADMAQLYYKTEDYGKALEYLDSTLACKYYNSAEIRYWTQRKTDEMKEICSQRAICLARLGRYAEAMKDIEPIIAYYKDQGAKGIRQYAESLRKKAKILMLRYDATGIYDPQAKACYETYLKVTKSYVDANFVAMSESEREQYWMAEQPFVTDCYRLEGRAPELLYDVALFSKAILLQMGRSFTSDMSSKRRAKALASMRVTWQQVQKALSAKAVAIEFIAYEKGGRKRIGALVLGKSGRPVFVSMFDKDSLMAMRLSSGYIVSDAFTATSQATVNAFYGDKQVSEIIWNHDIVARLLKADKIYFAADGVLHQIGIEYLVPDTLVGKSFYRLTSTRLLTEAQHRTRIDNMLMGGYIDYHARQTFDGKADNDGTAYSLMSSMHMDLATLDNSRCEVDSIARIRSKHHQDSVVTWDRASEFSIRQLLEKYHIVLLSTHGEFSEATTAGTDIRPATSDVQLSKSCLFFAGAVTNMNNPAFDATNPDGILSARELSGMDLSDVDLAVLSACMTGLGYITPDGVYGLQRGLKAAGVKAVIASLWPVDDQATGMLMTSLFRNLESGMGLYEAFHDARMEVRDSVTVHRGRTRTFRRKLFNKPYYYDAFLLIDGQE